MKYLTKGTKIITLDDISKIIEKMKNFHSDSDVNNWAENTLTALNKFLEKYNVINYELNKDSYMGIVLDCQTSNNEKIYIKNVPSFLGRFEHEIGCLIKIPEIARCIIKEYDYETQCVIMETIIPGDKAHFFENTESYKKLFDTLSANKIELDDDIISNYEYIFDVLKNDYEKYLYLIKTDSISSVGKEKAILYWNKFLKGIEYFNGHTNYLLHGDIHRGNALIGNDGVKVIDPLGFIAPYAFEFGATISYEMFDESPENYDDMIENFIEFASSYCKKQDLIIAIYCVLIKIYIPTFFEAKDGGIRNGRFLKIIEFMDNKFPNYLNL